MSSSDETSRLALLRAPFPANQISKLPKPYNKDSPKGKCAECGGFHGLPAVHLDYVGHAALTDRLLDVDPAWSWTPMAFTPEGLPLFDESGGLWICLTLCGVTRLGYGHAETKYDPGARVKEVIGDALRNAAMRFGAALDLWHKGQLHEETAPLPAAADQGEAPEGYDDWRADFISCADNGLPAMSAAWSASREEYRTHYLRSETKEIRDGIRERAKAATRA